MARPTPLEFSSHIGTIIASVVSLIALIASIKACSISDAAKRAAEDSNRISHEALENSKRVFALEKRPYLTLKPVKFSDTATFLKVRTDELVVTTEVCFEMINNGQTPAKNISFPGTLAVSTEPAVLVPGANPQVKMPLPIALGPSQSHTTTLSIGIKMSSQQAVDEYVNESVGLNTLNLSRNDADGLPLTLPLSPSNGARGLVLDVAGDSLIGEVSFTFDSTEKPPAENPDQTFGYWLGAG